MNSAGSRKSLGIAGAIAALVASYFFILLPWRSAALARTALAEINMGLYAQALADCDRAGRLRESPAGLHVARSLIGTGFTGDGRMALKEADLALASDPGRALAFAARSWAEISLQQYSEAKEDANRAIRCDSSGASGWEARGLAEAYQDEESSIEDCTRAIELEPSRTGPRVVRSGCRAFFTHSKDALEDAHTAIELGPLDSLGYFARTHRYSEAWKHREALADSERAVHLSGDPSSLVLRGRARLGRYRTEEARKDAEAALALHPAGEEAWLFRAEVTLAEGEHFERAIEDCTTALGINPRNASALFLRASVYLQLPDWAAAARDTEHAFALTHERSWALIQRAGLYQAMGKDAEVLADCEKAVRLNPRSMAAHRSLSNALADRRRDPEAIREADFIIETLDPGSPLGWTSRAYANMRSNTVEAAKASIEDSKRAQDLAPESEDPYRLSSGAWQVLANLYGQKNDADGERDAFKQALDEIERAKRKNERSPAVRFYEAALLLDIGIRKEAQKDRAAAQDYFKRARAAAGEAIRKNRNYVDAIQTFALACFYLGEAAQGVSACMEARERFPSRWDLDGTLGRMEELQLGRFWNPNEPGAHSEEVREHLRKALESYEQAAGKARAVGAPGAVRDYEKVLRYYRTWEHLYESTSHLLKRQFSASREELGKVGDHVPEFPALEDWRIKLVQALPK